MLQNHPAIFDPGSASAGGFYPYTVDYSCRFNDDDSAYLDWTPSLAGDSRTTFTLFACVKRGALGINGYLFNAGNDSNNRFQFGFSSLNELRVFENTGGTTDIEVTTDAVFRDCSAWYIIVLAVDTTEGTGTDRIKIWVNGIAQSLTFSTTPSASLATHWNNNVLHRIGARSDTVATLFDGYISQAGAIDGVAHDETLTGSDKSGIWVPKNLSGLTYGSNGFLLDFADSADLGNDVSGNGNDFTSSGLATNDQVTDTPTNNYAVFNPLKFRTPATVMDFSNGNLVATGSGTTPNEHAFGSMLAPTGADKHWYFEVEATTVTTEVAIGICDPNTGWGGNPNGYNYRNNGNKQEDGTSGAAYGDTYTSGDVIGVRVDGDNIYFYKNGTIQNSGTAAYTDCTTKFPNGFVVQVSGRVSDVCTLDAGQQGFTYTPPTGAVAICTENLPEPTIGPNSATKLSDVFAQGTYTGNGTAIGSGGLSINAGVDMTSGDWMVAIKNRDAADSWMVFDTVRGATKYLSFDGQDVEATDTESLNAFTATGFDLGSNVAVNTNTEDYVWYAFKVTAGFFDIQTWTGTGSAHTETHNLGVAPNFFTIKALALASRSWATYCSSLPVSDPETDALFLESNAAVADLSTTWNDTAPTSSNITIGTSVDVNSDTYEYVAYFWADSDISKVFYYEGNGDADGSFCYTRHRPDFSFFKRTDSTGSWFTVDRARSTYNPGSDYIRLDLPNAEVADSTIDLLSNGVKLRNAYNDTNASGADYIGLALGQPDKYSRAR